MNFANHQYESVMWIHRFFQANSRSVFKINYFVIFIIIVAVGVHGPPWAINVVVVNFNFMDPSASCVELALNNVKTCAEIKKLFKKKKEKEKEKEKAVSQLPCATTTLYLQNYRCLFIVPITPIQNISWILHSDICGHCSGSFHRGILPQEQFSWAKLAYFLKLAQFF